MGPHSSFALGILDLEALANLPRDVAEVVRVDHQTLLREKGRFAWVCVNIDVSEALPSSLKIPTPNHELNIPLIYEGLHEVCALCGSPIHTIDKCPYVPSLPKIEIMVEKFQAHNLNGHTPAHEASSSGTHDNKKK